MLFNCKGSCWLGQFPSSLMVTTKDNCRHIKALLYAYSGAIALGRLTQAAGTRHFKR